MVEAKRILMLGWEFPPFNSGGLGVACQGLAGGLAGEGAKVIFVLPKKLNLASPFCQIVFAEDIEALAVNSLLLPYLDSAGYQQLIAGEGSNCFYGQDLFSEVARYALKVKKLVSRYKFDLIHAHDWLCLPAGLAAKRASGRPLVAHIHATEFDRTGGHNINQHVYQIEKAGMEQADAVIAVSAFTKEKILEHYQVKEEKVYVVHNAAAPASSFSKVEHALKKEGKLVLFLGRLTLQKGPDYFLRAAQRVLEKKENVFFVVAGSGDMEGQLINLALNLGIADKVIFTGFLRGEQLERIYQLADLYVLSSVSEPFGITVLEALRSGTPVLLSKQSGVSEVLCHCLKVDFWDVEQMAAQILAVLEYNELKSELSKNSFREAAKFSWQKSAKKCLEVYDKVLAI